MQVGKIEYAPNYGRVISIGTHRVRYEHDDVDCDCPNTNARQHVEHFPDDLATTTFGPLHMYGVHEEVAIETLNAGLRGAAAEAALSVASTLNVRIPTNDNMRQVAANATESKDRGPYLTTYTGRFYFNDPRPGDFEIEDIAHSLAMTRRYSGHGKREYTTAEHSVHIYRWLRARGYAPDVCLAALLHDAPEPLSGFNDVASPRKKECPQIAAAELLIWRKAIAPKFELPDDLPMIVHEADKRICHDEMTQNLWEVDPNVGPPLGVTLEFWDCDHAEHQFMCAFREVQRDRQQKARAS